MIPILYKKDEVNFTSNGLGRLIDIIDMEVTEELNAQYTIEFTYPIDGHLFNYMIENGGVVFITHDDKGDFQAFDITGHTTTLDGVVVFRGEHVRYRLKNYVVKPFTATSCAQAGMRLMNNCMPQNNPFSFWTDKSSTGNFNLEVPQVAVSLLGGVEGSLLDVYGHGEYVFDMFDVKLYESRGIETGATIRYGKNLLSLNREYDDSDSYSAVAPFWSKDGVTVFTPDLYVASDYAPTEDAVWTTQDDAPITDNNAQDIVFRYRKIIPRPLDLTEAFEEPPTEDQLIYAAKNYLQRNRPWLPDENVEIDFVALWQTDEYESVASLQRLSLGDKVSVYYPEVNLIYENRQVIRVVYDPLNERYKSMELGKPKASLSEAVVDSSENDIRDIVNDAIGKSSAMEQAIAHATQLITGGLGGHVVLKMNAQGEPEEFLIMDTDDINTAVNVWRWNMGGLGHSHNGYNGPYSDVALTMDGRINANMITTGLLNAELIKAGVLSDEAGRNYWNMATGEFSLQGYATETYADLVGTNANSYTDQVFSESISEVDVEYAKNSSSSTAPTSGWSTNAPVWEDGKYIWTRTKTVSGGQTYYSDPVCITGAKGETGQQGQTGAGVSAIVEQYYLSTSSTTQTGGSWSTNQPAWASGKYIWTRSKITWTGGSTTYTDPVLAKAINGANQSAKDANDSVTALDESLNQQAIFNRLTNNGQTQGIYLQNGKIYINGTYIQAGTISGNYISGGSIAAGSGSGGTNALYIYGYDKTRGQYVLWGAAGGSTSVTSSDLLAFRARGYALSNFASNGGISENSQTATIKLGAIYGDTNLPSWNGKLEINCAKEPSSHPGHSGSSNQRFTSIIMNDGKIMCLYELFSESHETGGVILNGALPKNALPSSTGMYYMSIGDYSILDNSYRAGRISARDSSSDGYYLSIDNGSGTMLAGFYANAVSFMKEVDVNNDLIVSGTENRVVKTEDYGSRLFYSYETSSPMFGDVGEGKTDENGVCYVFIDPVVAESVNGKYYVFIQEYSPDRLWVDSVENAFFVVNGAPNTKFSWEIKAKQRGYENMRMERPEIKYTLQDKSYDVSLELKNDVAENAAEFYEQIISGRI